MKRTRVLGVAAILIGLALVLVRLDVIDAEWLRLLLPVILLLTGVYLIFGRSRPTPRGDQ